MSHAKWYAMKARLVKEGKWTGRQGGSIAHKVSNQEEGEPAPKQPRTDDGATAQESPETDPEMPALEDPETPEGKFIYLYIPDVIICE